MRRRPALALAAALLLAAPWAAWPQAQAARRVLFIGNSFTFGAGSAVQGWRAHTVTDLYREGAGGVPALFKAFTGQAGLAWDVSLATRGGVGLDFHHAQRNTVLADGRWDVVVMHGYSTLDAKAPGDPARLLRSSLALGRWLQARQPGLELHLLATWSRADQTYHLPGPWLGQPIDAMARDVRRAYDAAAEAVGAASVIPVGEAWALAMQRGVADANPYDGVAPGQLNLWASDHYHASAAGSYLAALVVFGRLTQQDPRRLGAAECAAFELGLAPAQAVALQQVAARQLGLASESPPLASQAVPARCPA